MHRCHVSYDTCRCSKLLIMFNYYRCHESAAAHINQCLVCTQLNVDPHSAGNLCGLIIPTSHAGDQLCVACSDNNPMLRYTNSTQLNYFFITIQLLISKHIVYIIHLFCY